MNYYYPLFNLQNVVDKLALLFTTEKDYEIEQTINKTKNIALSAMWKEFQTTRQHLSYSFGTTAAVTGLIVTNNSIFPSGSEL